MNHSENLTRYIANFIDELAANGLQHVVISPGSRSTPLAMTFKEHAAIKDWVVVDERSAAFFALGIARKTGKAVALVCTSGTAAANYYPAIIEAYHARVPLLVLTADRPHELRHIGASQTINQINMYANFIKHFEEMALPEANAAMLNYVRSAAARAIRYSLINNPGPVQLNFPFREPLVPDFTLGNLWGDRKSKQSFQMYSEGDKKLPKEQLGYLVEKLRNKKRGIIVCGPQTNLSLPKAVILLAEGLQIPILADPLSQLRTGEHDKTTVISTYDTILHSEEQRQLLKPDYVIRFGAMPVSKNFLFYTKLHETSLQIVIEDNELVREPTNQQMEIIVAEGVNFCTELTQALGDFQADNNDEWLSLWKNKQTIVLNELALAKDEMHLQEGVVVRELLNELPNESDLFVANSMPIRDVDTFLKPLNQSIFIHANRGVSGIDGNIATALGIAAVSNAPVTLIIGDLSFYHDLTSLEIAKRYDLNLKIILLNNNGGGIFSFLPQAEEGKHFEELFGTPLTIDFAKAISGFTNQFTQVNNSKDCKDSIGTLYNKRGLAIIEAVTNRSENVRWHRELWQRVNERLNADE